MLFCVYAPPVVRHTFPVCCSSTRLCLVVGGFSFSKAHSRRLASVGSVGLLIGRHSARFFRLKTAYPPVLSPFHSSRCCCTARCRSIPFLGCDLEYYGVGGRELQSEQASTLCLQVSHPCPPLLLTHSLFTVLQTNFSKTHPPRPFAKSLCF